MQELRTPDHPPRELLAIEALRWISAELVALLHADHERLKLAGRSPEIFTTHHLFELGIGVDIFFFISGFLMVHVSHGQFGAPGAAWHFFRRRLVRIVPLYWLATTAMIAAILAVPSLLNQHVLGTEYTTASFALIAWPDATGQVFPVLNSGWTLNLEIYFYAAFAVALLFRPGVGLLLVPVWLAVSILIAQIWQGSPWWIAFYGQPIALEFAAGVGLSVLFARGLRIGVPAALALAALALLLHLSSRAAWIEPPRLLGNGIPAGLVFVACVFCRLPPWPPRMQPIVRALGGSSYALYLTSPFAITACGVLLTRAGLHSPTLLLIAACLAAAILALLLHRFAEAPIARIGRRLLFPQSVGRASAHRRNPQPHRR